jgi:hypothetical protein
MDSRNHIMFGSVGDWFYKALAGIDHPDSDVGFNQFSIAPSVVGDLLSVNAYFLAGICLSISSLFIFLSLNIFIFFIFLSFYLLFYLFIFSIIFSSFLSLSL